MSCTKYIYVFIYSMNYRTAGETALALKGTRSMMPGAGSVDTRAAYLRLVDGLLALYHGAAVKYTEKVIIICLS